MPNTKRLCVCNCGKLVTRQTERRHEAGRGPSFLTSNILAQNPSLRRKKSSRTSLKQQLIGRPAPVRRALSLARDPMPNSTTSEAFNNCMSYDLPDVHNQSCPSQAILEGNSDFHMSEAGPSGVDNDSPEPSSPPSVPPLGDAEEYGLSNVRRSRRIANCVEKIGLQRWGKNHVRQFIVETSDDDDDDEVAEENQVTQEDGVMEDDDFIDSDEGLQEDEGEYETAGAEPGQEGVSLWDLLGESFLKEASRLGASASIRTFTDV
jgi:hypothetical protein